jgi:Mrp family chromosome partitioning ATPase
VSDPLIHSVTDPVTDSVTDSVTDNDDSRLPDLSDDLYLDEDEAQSDDSQSDDSPTDETPEDETPKGQAITRFQSRDILTRADSAEQIARMKNDFLLDPQEIREDRLITVANINERASNSFRELRRNVFDYTGKSNPIVMVSGVNEDVGSSLVAKNLAAAIALDETSTALIVNCNIRMNQEDDEVHAGLTDFLESKEIDEGEIIQHTGIPRLRRIGAGRRRELAGEYFSSARIRSLFSNISGRYPDRSIIIDGPPASTDAAILADLCDVILLVVAYGRNTENQIDNAIGVLGRDKIMGFVFNDQPNMPEYEW